MKKNKNPIKNIDWKKLKQQKESLICLVNSQSCDESELWKDIDGIINLIDSLQDYAVDVLGKDESEVFNLEK